MVKVADVVWSGPLLLLAVSPLMMFAAHAIVHRALDRAHARPTAHASALVALAGTFLVMCGAGWRLGVFDQGPDVFASLCAFAYVAAVYGALAILYIDVVNIAETSLHMHLLLELAWSDGIPVTELLERYSAERMIAARLERLISLGQIRVVDGRCCLASRSTLYLAGGVDVWRYVLGLPSGATDAAHEQPVGAPGSGR
jgi:hypothetical protein